jgi:murein DD-endopeptidase MepM/ murein hydrolase activator NlpD
MPDQPRLAQAGGLTLLLLAASAPSAWAFELDLPAACEIGKDCWVQQYPDHDDGPGIKDYTCGSATYDGHDGTDIRALNIASKIDVIASAPGIVKGLRDGEDDRLVKTEADRAAVKDRECGNGVVIAHEDGYETQYCHLRKGSVAVHKRQAVKAGTKLGEIGYSGDAAFPHVHLSVRRNGGKLDPFSGALADVCESDDMPLWSVAARDKLRYTGGDLLQFGWASEPVKLEHLETGALIGREPKGDWPVLVAYMLAINLRAGDVITVTLEGAGEPARNQVTLDRNKAQYMLFAGRKRPAGGWQPGDYMARVTVERGGQIVLERKLSAKF